MVVACKKNSLMVSVFPWFRAFSCSTPVSLIFRRTDLIKDAFLPAQPTETSDDEPGSASAPSHPEFFVETPIQTLQVNTALASSEHIRNYEFLGRVLGKTMYGKYCFELPPLFCIRTKMLTYDLSIPMKWSRVDPS